MNSLSVRNLFLGLFTLFAIPAGASEISCVGRKFDLVIENSEEGLIGVVTLSRQVVERLAFEKISVENPEYENLASLYQARTSTDTYGLYVFKEKEEGRNIAFLTIESHFGRQTNLEMRCE